MLPPNPSTDLVQLWKPKSFPSEFVEYGRSYTFLHFPLALSSRMLAQTYEIEAEYREIWKDGSFLQKGNQRALIQFNSNNFELSLRVRVEQRSNPCHINVAPDISLGQLPVLKDFKTEKTLGKGGNGTVYKGEWNGYAVAVKELLDANEDSESFLNFWREVLITHQLRHPNVVQLYGILLQPLRMVLEFVPCGDLYALLHDKELLPDNKFTLELRTRIALDIAKGLNYLHTQKIPVIHRDIRSPNIFLQSFCIEDPVVAKIGDFGLALVAPSISAPLRMHKIILRCPTKRDSPLGTWKWMAPETFSLTSSEYTEKADIYSFGIVLWELMERKFPFGEYEHLKLSDIEYKDRVVHRDLRPSISECCPQIYRNVEVMMLAANFAKKTGTLIQDCWSSYPDKRPTMSDIVALLEPPSASQDENTAEEKEEIATFQTAATLATKNKILSMVLYNSSIVAGCADGEICVWLQRDHSFVHTVKPPNEDASRLYSLVVFGRNLWAAYESGTVAAFDCNFQWLWQRREHQALLKSMAFAKEFVISGDAEFSGDFNKRVLVWNPKTFECIQEIVTIHKDSIHCLLAINEQAVWAGSLDKSASLLTSAKAKVKSGSKWKQFTTSSGDCYWYNETTQQSTWIVHDENVWEEWTTEDGTYWHNPHTLQSTWSNPWQSDPNNIDKPS